LISKNDLNPYWLALLVAKGEKREEIALLLLELKE